MLNISTRSLDRYIKAGKIRAKKEGKMVYVNSDDLKNLLGGSETKAKVIITKEEPIKEEPIINNNFEYTEESSTGVVKKSDYDKISATFEKVFSSLKEEIEKKDEKIQDLSVKLGRAEEMVKNSVSLIDHKKSQFLIEESKNHLNREISNLETEKNKVTQELKYEKTTNKLLITFVIILLAVAIGVWFMNI